MAVILGLGMSALAAPPPDAASAWTPFAKLRKPAGNLLFTIPWKPTAGLRLRVVEKAVPNREVLLSASTAGVNAVRQATGKGGDNTPIRPIIVRSEAFPKEAAPAVRVLVKFRQNDWQVYLNDRLAFKMPSPFPPPGRASLPANVKAAGARFQPVQDEFFHSDFMIEKGAPNPLYPWKPQTGDWQIHTAQEDALASPESDLNRVKKVPLTADKSPNFYSLKGKGKEAIITTGYPFYDEYEYAASVQIDDGEAGLVFYHRDKDNFYALTLVIHPRPAEGGTLVLWRMKNGRKTVLARIATPLYTGQWYQPRVKVGTDRIECYLDHIRVAGVSEALPPGGRIGLYADTAKGARFDDVKLDAVGELHLRNVEHIRFYTLLHKGAFFRDRSFWRAATPSDQLDLRPPRSARDQELIFGRPTHRGVVFRAEFAPARAPFTVGLVSGFTDESRPYYRFRYSRTALVESFALERVLRHDTLRTFYAWDRPLPPGEAPDRPVTLMADASTPGELRIYRDGQLVLIKDIEGAATKLTGASGLFVGRNSSVVVRNLDYRFKRVHDYQEKIEQNEIFKKDPFMRNWASPEGQWIAGAGGHMWHKSDFFGRFDIRLPAVKGAELEAGIPDGTETGTIAVKVGDGQITMTVGRDPKNPEFTKTAPIQHPAGKPQETVPFRLYYESYWTWLKVGDKVVARTRLPKPLDGTRVWVSGFKTEHLAQSRINRYMVKDDLFSESPHDWLAQGGTWQIINRFQCTPSWSHMIGESGEGLAAFWHKYLYGGDFTLEFYAGIRHGWYQRPGDLNCTAMAAETVPGSGYTVTATEYDPNLSENWSSFYRNGKRLLRSEKYLVPRRRKGYERKYLNPLLAKGRPIHGAWYYIKLRRIGRKLEYYFDNQLVFTWVDKEPIPEGLVGIWTFKQAMTVARVKISARTIRPRPFAFRLLPATPSPAPLRPPVPKAAARPVFPITDHGVPVNSLARTLWKLEDNVGHSRLLSRTMNADVLGIENHLGAGPMALKSELPPVPLDRIAGWRFRLKLTPTARLNFHYSLGKMDAKGKFTPTRKCFYQITGTDFTEGEYTRTGKSPLAPDRRFDPPGKGWHVETVWVPTRLRSGTAGDRNTYVRVEGFGNFQPSYFMAGLKGNFPGDNYTVRQFTPIFYGPPELALPPESPQPARLVLRSENGGAILCETAALADISKALLKFSKPGLNSAWIQVRDASDNGFSHALRWIQLPDAPDWSLNWDPDRTGAVLLRSKAPYPDPRFARARVLLAGKPLPLERENREVARALVPRSPEFARSKAPTLTFTVNLGAGDKSVALAWADSPNNAPPVLLGLTGGAPFFLTWENRTYPPTQAGRDPSRHILRNFDPIQGSFLEVRNRALEQRLRTVFTLGFPLSRFPLMQFRYRATDMVHVTAAFRGGYYIRLGDDYGPAIAVREGKDLARDNAWHTWLGFVTDGFALQPFSTARFQPASLTLGSAGSPDQTGRYSTWDLDDFVFGPAVRSAEQLVFTPRYYDPDGVRNVSTAVLKGDRPFFEQSPAERKAVKWTDFPPDTPIKPDLTGLPDGIHHIVLKAVDTRGNVSSVTDLPFLLDTKPLAPSIAVEPMANPAGNGVQLRITFANGGGAPWQISQAKFFVAGKQQKVPTWTNLFVHSATQDSLILNYPFLFREQLDKAKDGDVFEFAVDNILDGAGNATPRVTAPIRVKYKTDKIGPAWYTIKFDRNVHWFFNWDGAYDHTNAFSVGRNNRAQVVHQPNESAYFRTATYYGTGDAYRSVNWQPATHPWLSFRMRIPKYRSRTHLSVVLDTTKGTYTLSLKSPSKAKNELNRTQTIRWFGNKWSRFSFNVRKLLRAAGVSEADVRKLTVKTLYFRRRNSRHAELLDLDDVFLSSAAAGPGRDRLTWTAYDASGVAGLEAICYDSKDKELWRQQFTGRSADLSGLRKRAKSDTWLLCRARDKAGNLSVPFWMPFPNSD